MHQDSRISQEFRCLALIYLHLSNAGTNIVKIKSSPITDLILPCSELPIRLGKCSESLFSLDFEAESYIRYLVLKSIFILYSRSIRSSLWILWIDYLLIGDFSMLNHWKITDWKSPSVGPNVVKINFFPHDWFTCPMFWVFDKCYINATF